MKSAILFIIMIYKRAISPFLAPACRFYPSCSNYAAQSIQRHGITKGAFYSIKRLLKCHPFHEGGFDPIKE